MGDGHDVPFIRKRLSGENCDGSAPYPAYGGPFFRSGFSSFYGDCVTLCFDALGDSSASGDCGCPDDSDRNSKCCTRAFRFSISIIDRHSVTFADRVTGSHCRTDSSLFYSYPYICSCTPFTNSI